MKYYYQSKPNMTSYINYLIGIYLIKMKQHKIEIHSLGRSEMMIYRETMGVCSNPNMNIFTRWWYLVATRMIPELLPKRCQKATRWQQYGSMLPYYLVQKYTAELLSSCYLKCHHLAIIKQQENETSLSNYYHIFLLGSHSPPDSMVNCHFRMSQ